MRSEMIAQADVPFRDLAFLRAVVKPLFDSAPGRFVP
jgi:hypothetical protein